MEKILNRREIPKYLIVFTDKLLIVVAPQKQTLQATGLVKPIKQLFSFYITFLWEKGFNTQHLQKYTLGNINRITQIKSIKEYSKFIWKMSFILCQSLITSLNWQMPEYDIPIYIGKIYNSIKSIFISYWFLLLGLEVWSYNEVSFAIYFKYKKK